MKAVAIPYIIAILLGVGVIGLVGYWFFVSGGQFGTGVANQQCRTDFQQSCQTWVAVGYSTNIPPKNGVFENVDNNACLKQITGSGTALPDDATSKTKFQGWC